MGQLGKFADQNLAPAAAFDPAVGVWSEDLPLANLQAQSRYKGAPARCEDCSDLENSQFRVTLAAPWAVSLVGFLFHTMGLAAKYRVTGRAPGGTWEDPAFVTEWMDVYGRLYNTEDLPYEAENLWTGQVTQAEIDLVAQHRFLAMEPQLVDGLWFEFDDVTNDAGFFDIGGLWISSTFTPEINFQRGLELGVESRSQQDEGPSGRLFTEARPSRRTVTVAYDANTTAEARRWVDAGLRAGIGGTVIFLPDSDDEPGSLRDAFPAVFARPPSARFNYPTINPVGLTFREILA